MPTLGGLGLAMGAIIARGLPGVVVPPVDIFPQAGETFYSYDSATAPFATSVDPTGFYLEQEHETWMFNEAWSGVRRTLSATIYDHATGAFKGPFHAVINLLTDDHHGVPCGVPDAFGRVHLFGGSHGSPVQHVVTANPLDPTLWIEQPSPLVGTYPHPIAVGNAIYLFIRGGAYNQDTSRLEMVKINTAADGTLTREPLKVIGNLNGGAVERWYQGQWVRRGTDLHHVWCRGDANDFKRQDVYYLIYDTLTGDVRNFDGSVVVSSALLPVQRTVLDASFRLVDQTSTGRIGGLPCLVFDPLNRPHVLYKDGTTPGNTQPKHMLFDNGVWATTDIPGLPAQANRGDAQTGVALADGSVQQYWTGERSGFVAGGDIWLSEWDAATGVWGTPTKIHEPERDFALDRACPILDGHPDLLVHWGERVLGEATEADLRAYAYGQQGFVRRPSSSVADQVPNVVVFTDKIEQNANVPVAADQAQTITGLGAGITVVAAPTSINTTVSYNGGAFINTARLVRNGDTVLLRRISSGASEGEVTAVLALGRYAEYSFTVRTKTLAEQPAFFMEDTFTGFDDTALINRVGENTGAWSLMPGTSSANNARLRNNRVYSPVANQFYRTENAAPSGEYSVNAVLDCLSVIASDNIGIAARASASTLSPLFYFMRYNRTSNAWQVYRTLDGGGGSTLLGPTFADNFPADQSREVRLRVTDDPIDIEISGVVRSARIIGYIDGTPRLYSADTLIVEKGFPGLRFGAAQTQDAGVQITRIWGSFP